MTSASFCSPIKAPYGDLLLAVPRTSRNSSFSSWMESSVRLTTQGFSVSPGDKLSACSPEGRSAWEECRGSDLCLTWEESDDRRVGVGPLTVVHHDLSRTLAGVAAHRGLDANVSAAVHYGFDLPIRLIHLVRPFFKLNLWHCQNNYCVIGGSISWSCQL